MSREGFVTVSHTLDQLKRLQDIEAHIVAKDKDRVIAYTLTMTRQSTDVVPTLAPMFAEFDRIRYKGDLISSFEYVVVGQACVDKAYRGQGVLDRLYLKYKNRLCGRYDFAITEIAVANARSYAAHKRIGFVELARYTAPDGIEWCIVVWPW